jgi:hypothetical protein
MFCRAAAILAACAAAAAAQDLRGVVRDANNQQPVAGAVVRLIGAAGNEVSRALSNERGEYRLLLSGQPGKVRVVKIGFRPTEHDVPAIATGSAVLDVAIRPLATMLEVVNVVDQPGCPRRADRAKALALWEQAKSGLLASVIARDVPAADLRVLLYTRYLSPIGSRILDQTVRIHAGEAAAPFRAAKSAGDFVAEGFIQERKSGNVYYAPDADVLLDENFPRGYCFAIAARERDRPTQIGLSFAPMQRQRNVVTVDGTLWIDTAARRIVDLEYQYRMDDVAAMRLNPGGRLSWHEMENGVVFIDRWFIRMVAARPDAPDPGVIRSPTAALEPTKMDVLMHRVSEGGGELARASWPGEVVWTGSLGTLRASVTSRAGDPVSGARVRLSSTDYRAVTDSAGVAVIPELLPGPYTVELEDPMLARIGVTLETKTTFTAARDRQSDVKVTLQSADDYVTKLCKDNHVYDRKSLKLIARVVARDGTPVPRASVESDTFHGATDDNGIFVVCSELKPGKRIQIKAWSGDGVATVTSVLLESVLTALRIEVAVPPKP